MEKIFMGIKNFYGEVEAYEKHGKYYIELDDYSRSSTKEISKEFYNAIKKEYGVMK